MLDAARAIADLRALGLTVEILSGDLAGLARWGRPSALVLSDGAAVAVDVDASGSGRTFAQALSANRPTYDADGINGQPAVRYTSAGANSSWMQCDSEAQELFGGTLPPWTWVAVPPPRR